MRRIVSSLLLGALLASPAFLVVADNPATITITLIRNPDGTFNPQYRAGDKNPDPLTLVCDNSEMQTPIAGVTGSAYSSNVRQFFEGTGAATATLSVGTFSGDNATTEGWSIADSGAGDTLEHDGGETGSGVLQIIGTTGGDPVLCPLNIAWAFADPPSVDNPPSAPGTPVLNERTETTMSISWAAATDDAGIASYKVYRAATSCANTFSLLGQQPLGTETNFTQTGLSAGSIGCYRVRAVDTAGQESDIPDPDRTLLVGAYEEPETPSDVAPWPRVGAGHYGTTDYTDLANCADMGSLDIVYLHWHAGTSRTALSNCIAAARAARPTLRPGRSPTVFATYINRDSVPTGAVWDAHRAVAQDAKLWASERTIGTLAAGQLTRSGSVATVNTPVNHGLSSGNLVAIYDASPTAYNGVKTITVVDANTFTFSVSGSPSSPATGTISVRGPIGTIFSNVNQAINETNVQVAAEGLPYSQWHIKWAIDTWGVAGSGLDGLFNDNFAPKPLLSYDYDRNGATNSNTSADFKAALATARQAQVNYIHGRGYLACANSAIMNPLREYWTTGLDDRPTSASWGIDCHLLESLIGLWNSPEGIGYFTGEPAACTNGTNGGPSSSCQLRTWPGNATFPSNTPIPTGTIFQSTFGRYHNGATPPASAIGYYQTLKLSDVGQDPALTLAQTRGPAPNRIGSWSGAAQYMRYNVVSVQVMSDYAADYYPVSNGSFREVIRIDETEFDWGQALDPAQTIADEVAGRCNMREFELALAVVCHRQEQGSSETFTNRVITLPSAGTGKKWQYIDASDFLNQDPAFNTGADAGATITLAPRSVRVLRRVNQ
jgi:hypothetical protein